MNLLLLGKLYLKVFFSFTALLILKWDFVGKESNQELDVLFPILCPHSLPKEI